MKNNLILAVSLLFAGLVGTASAKDLKVLMIGNSFSVCVGTYLPSIVQTFPEHSLELTSAMIGGCPLEKHVNNIKAAEKDPEKGKYGITVWTVEKGSPVKHRNYRGNLIDLLKKQAYDIVTIQQASRLSWKWESYEPFAGELIAFIRQCQPNAEIVIQQTWAYRADAASLKSFKVDQTGMYEHLRDAYRQLAEKYKLRVIPTGDAVQLFRKYTPVKYQAPADKNFEYPNVPSHAGDVVGSAKWAKPKKAKGQTKDEGSEPEKLKLRVDTHHLNPDGHYLQACVWFSFLYGEPADKITWAPEGMAPDFAALCRRCAKEAVENYTQVK